MKKIRISRSWYTIQECENNPNSIYVFGDNCIRIGRGGQATIRGLRNAFGVATKISPSINKKDYFSDKNYENNCRIISDDLMKIYNSQDFDTVVFPYDGLGTGLSKLPEMAPSTYNFLCMKLFELFDITTTAEGKLVIL